MVVLGTHTNLKPVAKARAAKTGSDLFPVVKIFEYNTGPETISNV